MVLIFGFSFFPNFKWLLSKILQLVSSVLWKFYYVTNFFDLNIFDNEMVALLKIFEIFKEMHFVSLFFLKKRNITISLLMIHLKCTVVHYANLNSNSINKLFLNDGTLNMLCRYFSISCSIFILMKILSNNYHCF